MAAVANYLKKREVERVRAAVFDKNGLPTMNAAAIKLSCMEHDGYETPALNEKLFLHFRGYRKIENLEEYPNVKTLFLESNGLRKIENIQHLTQLRCLYLHQNVIEEISGLNTLCELRTLNLSQNRISKVSNLKGLENLSTLNLAKNCLSDADDLKGLLECPSITNLDLSSNNIEDIEIVEKVLKKMPKISALYLKGNPCVRKIKHYRKTMLSTMPQLAYLDERPVFELERVAVAAWKEGGIEAEREARKQFQNKKINDDRESMKTFRKWKEERRAARKALIQKCKDEGKPVPKPKSYVSYRELTNAELDRVDKDNRALLKAEKMAGDNPNDIKALGRQYWKDRGVPVYDDNGNLIVDDEKDTKEQSSVSNSSTTSSSKKSNKETKSPNAPPAPSTAVIHAPPAPPLTEVQKAKGNDDIAKLKAQEEERQRQEMEENERQNRVSESYRMYQQQRRNGQKASERNNGKLTFSQKIMQEQNELRKEKIDDITNSRDARKVGTDEGNLSQYEKEKLQQMVAEADEEEDNYRSSRSRMKQQAKQRSSRSNNIGWTTTLDKKLQSAVLKHIFDFEKVANEIGATSEACRLRYAMLDRSRTDASKPANPLTLLVEKEAKRNKANIDKQHNPQEIQKNSIASNENKFVKANTNSSDPFASLAASASGLSNVTVDFSKLPSMKGDESSDDDDDEDVQPGIFSSALRSQDMRSQVFGGANGVDENNLSENKTTINMESTDVDGLD
eukprot:g7908.t1